MPPDTLKPNRPSEYQVLKTKQKRYLLTSPRPSPSPSQIQKGKGKGEFGLWAVTKIIWAPSLPPPPTFFKHEGGL